MSIPLSSVLSAIREELKEAQANSDPKNPLIVENIEVELQTMVTQTSEVEGEGSGKIELKVLDFLKLGEVEAKMAGKGGLEKATTQTIKLTLSAKSLNEATGQLEQAKVSDQVKHEPKLK